MPDGFGTEWGGLRKIPKGLEIPRPIKVGYAVNPKDGDGKIPQDLGGEIQRHPCLYRPSDPWTGIWWDCDKYW